MNRIELKIPGGRTIVAEIINNENYDSIDVTVEYEDGGTDIIAFVEYERSDKFLPPKGLRAGIYERDTDAPHIVELESKI